MQPKRYNSILKLLWLGMAALIFLSASLAWVGRSGATQLSEITQNLYLHPFAVSNSATQLLGNFHKLRAQTLQVVALGISTKDSDAMLKSVQDTEAAIAADLAVINRNFLGDIGRVKQLEQLYIEWRSARGRIFELYKQGNLMEAERTINTVSTPLYLEMLSHAEYVKNFAQSKAAEFYEVSNATTDSVLSKLTLLASFILGVIVLLGSQMALWVASVLRSLDESNEEIQREHALRHQLLEEERNKLEVVVADRTSNLQDALIKADEASRAKTLFIGNMSHEMRTPLHQISGVAGLFRRDSLTEKQSNRLGMLESAVKRLDTVIGGILTLVDLESRSTTIKLRQIFLGKVIGEVASMLDERSSDKELSLVQDICPLPSPLMGDDRHLVTILSCYLGNAISYSENGRITIRVEKLAEDAGSVLIRLSVEDQGIGIDPAHVPRLFENFEQVDNSNTRKYGGTGVGLAIVKKLAKLMDGDAGCNSCLGEGSQFWATCRLVKGGPQSHQAEFEDFQI